MQRLVRDFKERDGMDRPSFTNIAEFGSGGAGNVVVLVRAAHTIEV